MSERLNGLVAFLQCIHRELLEFTQIIFRLMSHLYIFTRAMGEEKSRYLLQRRRRG